MKPVTYAAALLACAAAVPQSAFAFEAGDILVRARAILISPDVDATVTTPPFGTVEISDKWTPEVDISYFLTDDISLELIAATAYHSVRHEPTGLDVGEVGVLPPTLLLQYHIDLPNSDAKPYLGVGVNYTHFYDADPGVFADIDYEDSWGFALQAGIDLPIDDEGRWLVNLDIKKIFIRTDVSINGGAILADVDIDPWVIGVGVGYRF